MHLDFSYKASFIGGTIFGVLPNIHSEDIVVTSVMAVIGAVVSFLVTFILRKLFSSFKNPKK
jgi:hypothetical protein